MTEEENRKLSSLLGTLKGTIIQNVKSNDYEKFISWCNKLALDTNKDKVEKTLLKKIKAEKDLKRKAELVEKKKSIYHQIIHQK